MKKITIAIDGFSSTGKSTLAKQLAKALNYIYVDTGAMYRAVTYICHAKRVYYARVFFDKQDLINQLHNIYLSFKFNEELGYAEIYLNDENVRNCHSVYRSFGHVSQIATVSEIRSKLVQQQKRYGIDKGVVMDGRDIGTVVFPDAELKIFMTASAEIRAQRRYLELCEKRNGSVF